MTGLNPHYFSARPTKKLLPKEAPQKNDSPANPTLDGGPAAEPPVQQARIDVSPDTSWQLQRAKITGETSDSPTTGRATIGGREETTLTGNPDVNTNPAPAPTNNNPPSYPTVNVQPIVTRINNQIPVTTQELARLRSALQNMQQEQQELPAQIVQYRQAFEYANSNLEVAQQTLQMLPSMITVQANRIRSIAQQLNDPNNNLTPQQRQQLETQREQAEQLKQRFQNELNETRQALPGYQHAFEIANSNLQTALQTQSMLPGSIANQQTLIQQKEAELTNLNQALTVASDITSAQGQLTTLLQNQQQDIAGLAAARNRAEIANSNLAVAQEVVHRLPGMIANLDHRIQDLQATIDNSNGTTEELESLRAQLAQAQEQRQRFQTELDDTRQAIPGYQETLRVANNDVGVFTQALTMYPNLIASHQAGIQELFGQLTSLTQTLP